MGMQDWTVKSQDKHDNNFEVFSDSYLLYNDLEESDLSGDYCTLVSPDKADNSHTKIVTGRNVKCPVCRDNLIDIPRAFACLECLGRAICEICGFYCEATEIEDIRGELVCPDCVEDYCVMCERCNELFWEGDTDIGMTEQGEYCCNFCMASLDEL